MVSGFKKLVFLCGENKIFLQSNRLPSKRIKIIAYFYKGKGESYTLKETEILHKNKKENHLWLTDINTLT